MYVCAYACVHVLLSDHRCVSFEEVICTSVKVKTKGIVILSHKLFLRLNDCLVVNNSVTAFSFFVKFGAAVSGEREGTDKY